MARLVKNPQVKGGMEIAYDNFKKDAEALGMETETLDKNLEEALEEIAEENPTAYKEILSEMVRRYFDNKSEMDTYKKQVDKDNNGIKEIMIAHNLDSFEVDGITATCSVSPRESFDDVMLLQILKDAKVKGVIKKKEYVDTDALESLIYKGKVDATILAPARIVKDVITLNVKKKKEKK